MKKIHLLTMLALVLVTLPALADTIKLVAGLTGGPGSPVGAGGSSEFTFDTATNQLTYFVRYQNLSGDVTSADVHGPGRPADNAPVIFHFVDSDSPIEGTKTLSQSQASELLNGQFYLELDTNSYPAGEIRGQIHQ